MMVASEGVAIAVEPTSSGSDPSKPRRLQQLRRIHLEGFGKPNQLPVGDAPDLGFHLGQGLAADVPPGQLEASGELGLRESFGLSKRAQRRTNHVLLGSHLF